MNAKLKQDTNPMSIKDQSRDTFSMAPADFCAGRVLEVGTDLVNGITVGSAVCTNVLETIRAGKKELEAVTWLEGRTVVVA